MDSPLFMDRTTKAENSFATEPVLGKNHAASNTPQLADATPESKQMNITIRSDSFSRYIHEVSNVGMA